MREKVVRLKPGLTGPLATALLSLSMTKLCCHLLCFVMLGILVHSACGLEKDHPRVDGE